MTQHCGIMTLWPFDVMTLWSFDVMVARQLLYFVQLFHFSFKRKFFLFSLILTRGRVLHIHNCEISTKEGKSFMHQLHHKKPSEAKAGKPHKGTYISTLLNPPVNIVWVSFKLKGEKEKKVKVFVWCQCVLLWWIVQWSLKPGFLLD